MMYAVKKLRDFLWKYFNPQVRILRKSGLFDVEWYLDAYPDVKAVGNDPILHYLLHGAAEGRDPSRFFSTRFYLNANADVAQSKLNPLVHYTLYGRTEKRLGSPDFASDAASFETKMSRRLNLNFRTYPSAGLARYGMESVVRQLFHDATPPERLARFDPDRYSPLISIILPVFNTPPRFLWEAIQSVRAQTYDAWQICVVDDCSSEPATLDVLNELRKDHKIDVYRLAQNVGIAKASHNALLEAKGEYIGFLDHDDLLMPNALSEVVAKLRDDPKIDYLYSDHVQADADGLPFSFSRKPDWSPEFLLSTNYIVHFKVVRRELLISLGGLNQERSQAQDLAMSLRLMRNDARVAHIPQGLYLWREHKGSVAGSTTAKPGIEGLLVDTYADHLREVGSSAQPFWPKVWSKDRIGAFQLGFKDTARSTALVVISSDSAASYKQVMHRHALSLTQDVKLYVISISRRSGGAQYLKDDREVRRFFANVLEENIVLVGDGRFITRNSISTLVGMLNISPYLGAVGGKVLSKELKVISGGFLQMSSGEYGMICGGEFDNSMGHWLNGQIVSNVDAVASRCMAVRRKDLAQGPGLLLHKWGELAGIILSQELSDSGQRIAYDPTVKLYDEKPVELSGIQFSKLFDKSKGRTPTRIYKEFTELPGHASA